MYECIVWIIDAMGKHIKEKTFTSFDDALTHGCELELTSEEDWYIEERINGTFIGYLDS